MKLQEISIYLFPLKLNIYEPTLHDNFLHPAPCVPRNVSVIMDCTKNEATVSWIASQGATYYRVLAISKNNNNASCNSSAVNTFCVLKGLTCGAVYTVQVVAFAIDCSSLLSLPVDFLSGMINY